jgi:PAS domain S-box-containing protein
MPDHVDDSFSEVDHVLAAHLARVLDTTSVGFVSMDHDWRITYLNAEAVRLMGVSRDDADGREIWELLPAAIGPAFDDDYRRAIAAAENQVIEAYFPSPLDAWYDIRAAPNPDGISLYFHDVTSRRATQDLLQLSERASELLMRALDSDRALAAIARHVVPRLADWAIISAIDPDGSIRDLGTWHSDPALLETLEVYARTRFEFLEREASGPVAVVRRTREPLIVESGTTAAALAQLRSEDARRALTVLAPESTVMVPLMAGDRLLGVLGMWRGADRTPMTDQELTVAVSVGRRTGLALDNIRLHAEQRAEADHNRTVARALQDAMLTRLPEPDHLHLVARYLTAAEAEDVGGDWYDALIDPDGATTLVIGDVLGHNMGAAAIMGQLRNLLRMAVVDHPGPPAATLSRLDQAMSSLKIRTLATVTLLVIEQVAADQAAGLRTLRWSNAGHPAPVLVHADGTAELLDTPNDPLLGAFPDIERHDHTCSIAPGSTLLLYTDGLVESRTRDIDHGQNELLLAAQRHHGLETGALLDALLADLVGDQPADDVALLAVRFHGQSAPRPIEAGPELL